MTAAGMKLTQEDRSKSFVVAQLGKLAQDPQNKGKRKTCRETNLARKHVPRLHVHQFIVKQITNTNNAPGLNLNMAGENK
jgi:hypothetical protein